MGAAFGCEGRMMLFLAGFVAAQVVWFLLWIGWYIYLTRSDANVREHLQENFADVREAIKRRMAPRN